VSLAQASTSILALEQVTNEETYKRIGGFETHGITYQVMHQFSMRIYNSKLPTWEEVVRKQDME
jgi:hypothetical protein